MRNVLVTADWHLRKSGCIWPKYPTITGDIEWGMRQVMNQITHCDNHVSHVLLLGDVFNERVQRSQAVINMRDWVAELATHGVELLYVQGQHERATPTWLSAIHPWPQHIHEQVVEITPNFRVYGLDYQFPHKVREALARIPREANVLATHQVWKDFLSADSGDAWFEWVPDNIELIITGDYHVHEARNAPGKCVLSPGPLCPQRIDENTNTGTFLVDTDTLVYQYMPLSTRHIYQVAISDEAQLHAFCDGWAANTIRQPGHGPEATRKNILRVHYLTTIPRVWEAVQRAVGDDVHLFPAPQNPRQEQDTIAEQDRIETVLDQGMPGIIRQFYSDDAQAASDAIRIWASLNPTEEIKAIVHEHMSQ